MQKTVGELKEAGTDGTIFQFTGAFSHQLGHQLLSFRPGKIYYLDDELKAALLALGAPMVAA